MQIGSSLRVGWIPAGVSLTDLTIVCIGAVGNLFRTHLILFGGSESWKTARGISDKKPLTGPSYHRLVDLEGKRFANLWNFLDTQRIVRRSDKSSAFVETTVLKSRGLSLTGLSLLRECGQGCQRLLIAGR